MALKCDRIPQTASQNPAPGTAASWDKCVLNSRRLKRLERRLPGQVLFLVFWISILGYTYTCCIFWMNWLIHHFEMYALVTLSDSQTFTPVFMYCLDDIFIFHPVNLNCSMPSYLKYISYRQWAHAWIKLFKFSHDNLCLLIGMYLIIDIIGFRSTTLLFDLSLPHLHTLLLLSCLLLA